MNLFTREPVLTLAVVQAAIALVVSFGLDLSPEQVGAILAFTAAVLGWLTRTKVTPTADPRDGDGAPLVPAKPTA